MRKKSKKHSSQILNSCFYLFFVSYMINYYKSLMLVILYSHVKKKKKEKESTIVWHLKCIVKSLINVDYSIKIHLNETFFLLLMQSHSLCSVEQVLTRTRQNSLYLKCKFWQVLGFFLQLNANFCQVSSKIKTKHNHQWTDLARNDKRDRQG